MATYFTEDINFNGHVNTKLSRKPITKDTMHMHGTKYEIIGLALPANCKQ